MDILSRVRQLLGGNHSKKRKASDEDSLNIRKKFREASVFYTNSTSKFDLPTENSVRYVPLSKTRGFLDYTRLSTSSMKNSLTKNYTSNNNHHMVDHSTPAHSSREPWGNSPLDNSMGATIEDVTDDSYQSKRTYVPYLQPIKTTWNSQSSQRQIPSLIKANTSSIQRKVNGSMYNERPNTSKIPQLYPIDRTSNAYNGHYAFPQQTVQTHQPRPTYASVAGNHQSNHVNNRQQPAFNNLTQATNYFAGNSLSMKQNLASRLTENGIHQKSSYGRKEAAPEKQTYFKLLKNLIPFYSTTSKSQEFDARDTLQPQEIIDLANENEDFRETINSTAPVVEPVNTLRTRMETKPVYDDGWVTELNEQFSTKSQNHSKLAETEKERSWAAERATREQESKFLDRLKSLEIDGIYDLSEGEEEAYNDFPTLTDDQLQKINAWFYGRDLGQVLFSKFNISITRRDIQTLSWEPLAWLNDEVINFYMELLTERSQTNESLPNVHAMNTFFLKRLLEAGYNGVRRWTRKVDVFAQDVIPVPVHKGIHWCMAIIHMKDKTIKYYDSMGAPNNVTLKALADWLQAESIDKRKQPLDMSDWTQENVQNIPQQENGSDCGVFSCMYAEFITRNRPILFTQQHMQYFRKRMVYEICTGQLLV